MKIFKYSSVSAGSFLSKHLCPNLLLGSNIYFSLFLEPIQASDLTESQNIYSPPAVAGIYDCYQ